MRASNKEVKISILVLLPSIIFLAIFVYGFIANTFSISLTDWGSGSGGLKENPVINFIGAQNYSELFTAPFWSKFRQDLVNAVFYWIGILAGTIILGFFIAVLLDKYPKGESFFRTLFLYPMALSFIVTGTVWNWLLQPEGGINMLPTFIGLPKIEFQWLNEYGTILKFDWNHIPTIITVIIAIVAFIFAVKNFRNFYSKRFLLPMSLALLAIAFAIVSRWGMTPLLPYEEPHGFNIGIIGIIFAAIWQYVGYAMAVYLAGLRGLSQDLYEAAKMDGASDAAYYLKIALPNLNPITLSAIIILSHISLKLFALIFAMSKPDNPITGHPSVDMFLTTFRGNNFAMGAAMASLLFLLASLFIIPYVVYTFKQRQR
ncbi:MAG: sugar ABC transporter permease [Deltaproteobacteria bacterium]|nr:sugar ABC transporter permease [Deltaproteobacteria bacterium]